MIRECVDCGESYDPTLKHNKPGYIDQCGACGRRSEVERYVGRSKGEKSVQIEIFRQNTEYWRRQLRRENAVGFNANLPVSNPVFESNRKDD